ncbi:MAG: hypothetical protein DRQ10_00690 [Candidatus Hydrothermota bacterium]|nr:MAG: hypothetical protein DRQ10_00690 [Candidatus Hydrothermae bacterium]
MNAQFFGKEVKFSMRRIRGTIRVAVVLMGLAVPLFARFKPEAYSSASDLFHASKIAFNQGKIDDAIKGFQSLVYRFPADEYADDAQYYLGLCYMKKKDYSSAINEFRILLESYPYSEWVDETILMMATAYFEKSPSPDRDQTDTETALELARQFLIKFPHSELRAEAESLILKCKSKLARKLLIAIDTFVKLGKYKAAEVYLDIIDSEYPDVPEIWDAKYYRALVYSKTGRVDEAEDILTQILEDKNAPREVRAKAGALIWKVRG